MDLKWDFIRKFVRLMTIVTIPLITIMIMMTFREIEDETFAGFLFFWNICVTERADLCMIYKRERFFSLSLISEFALYDEFIVYSFSTNILNVYKCSLATVCFPYESRNLVGFVPFLFNFLFVRVLKKFRNSKLFINMTMIVVFILIEISICIHYTYQWKIRNSFQLIFRISRAFFKDFYRIFFP